MLERRSLPVVLSCRDSRITANNIWERAITAKNHRPFGTLPNTKFKKPHNRFIIDLTHPYASLNPRSTLFG